jgi:Flp pilus assembly protein TadB
MRQLARFYRWGNDRRSLGPFLGILALAGLVCLVVGAGTGIPEILVGGLLIIFFMVPVIYLRERSLYWIRDHLGKRREQE